MPGWLSWYSIWLLMGSSPTLCGYYLKRKEKKRNWASIAPDKRVSLIYPFCNKLSVFTVTCDDNRILAWESRTYVSRGLSEPLGSSAVRLDSPHWLLRTLFCILLSHLPLVCSHASWILFQSSLPPVSLFLQFCDYRKWKASFTVISGGSEKSKRKCTCLIHYLQAEA